MTEDYSEEDDVDEKMEMDSQKTPLFKYMKKKMKYSGYDEQTSSFSESVKKHIMSNDVINGSDQPSNSSPPTTMDGEMNLGMRLDQRRTFVRRRRRYIDVQFASAMFGILVMMVETELVLRGTIDKNSGVSMFLKSVISFSTIILLICIVLNYYLGFQIKILDGGLKDWTTVITPTSVVWLVCELLICSIHPFPGDFVLHLNPELKNDVDIDAFLAILMVNRLYLIGKFAVIHSRLLTDSSTNCIGALSKVKINTKFVFKAAMTTKPGMVVMLVMILTFIMNTWAMRTCEIFYEGKNETNTIVETMWLIAITFLTVGYGDRTPMSYCGRYVSIVTGVMGVITTAMVVAIMAKNLQQTRSEKYVFSLISRLQNENRKKTAAANAIKNVFRIWILKKYGENDEFSIEIRRCEDRLKQALKEIKLAKEEMCHIADSALGMVDVAHTVNRIYDIIEHRFNYDVTRWESRLVEIDNRLYRIEGALQQMVSSISVMPSQKT